MHRDVYKRQVVALEKEGIIYADDKNVGIYEIPDSAAAHGGERNLKIGIISVNEEMCIRDSCDD